MDPNENLRQQLELSRAVLDGEDGLEDTLDDLAELVVALHEWIENGGALPSIWQEV